MFAVSKHNIIYFTDRFNILAVSDMRLNSSPCTKIEERIPREKILFFFLFFSENLQNPT